MNLTALNEEYRKFSVPVTSGEDKRIVLEDKDYLFIETLLLIKNELERLRRKE
jgi:hypothetical protein